MSDLIKEFESRLSQIRREDEVKTFVVSVTGVRRHEQNQDLFQVRGVRADTGKTVYVSSKKSSSGQYVPEVGDLLRADKASRLPTGNNPEIACYKAEYFHTYGADDLCLRAVIRADRPKQNNESQMWSAQVSAFDVENGVELISAPDQLDAVLLKMLKPWEANPTDSPIQSDLKGSAIWSDKPRQGITPKVALRMAGGAQHVWVSGPSVVNGGTAEKPAYRFPNDTEILNYLARNQKLTQLRTALANMEQERPGFLAKEGLIAIPGVSFVVGRDSLSGDTEKYLRVPEAFTWTDRDNLNGEGHPQTRRGYREAYVHVKTNSAGRMMVVDVVPSPNGRLTPGVPDTSVERAIRAAAEQSEAASHNNAAPAAASESSAAMTTKKLPAATAVAANHSQKRDPVEEPAAKASQPSPVRQPSPAANPVQAQGEHSFVDDFSEEFMGDIAAMEAMNQSQDTDSFPTGDSFTDDLDSLLNEAVELRASRSIPRMG